MTVLNSAKRKSRAGANYRLGPTQIRYYLVNSTQATLKLDRNTVKAWIAWPA